MTPLDPSDELLYLAATLISHLPPAPTAPSDTTLAQLSMIYGPMLMSALQLVDRREVVMVHLPSNRSIWQVTSSAGAPYSIYISLPPPPAGSLIGTEDEVEGSHAPPTEEAAEVYVRELVQCLKGMYCPCTGFAYNTLAGSKNYFCKHLLGVVLAHQMGREVRTSVNLRGVAALLGLARREEQAEPGRTRVPAFKSGGVA